MAKQNMSACACNYLLVPFKEYSRNYHQGDHSPHSVTFQDISTQVSQSLQPNVMCILQTLCNVNKTVF